MTYLSDILFWAAIGVNVVLYLVLAAVWCSKYRQLERRDQALTEAWEQLAMQQAQLRIVHNMLIKREETVRAWERV